MSADCEFRVGILLIIICFINIGQDRIYSQTGAETVGNETLPFQPLQVAHVKFSIQALHQAAQQLVCTLLTLPNASDHIVPLIHQVVQRAIRFHSHPNATEFCP
jgi:predicted Abi (CAAX) family protease